MSNKPLRAGEGFDASGKKIINLAYPDIGTDGVNVDYFKYENTVQPYDQTRTYPAGFAVTFQNRVYVSLQDITIAEPFNINKWRQTRTDPNWKVVTSTDDLRGDVSQGDYILNYVRTADAIYKLPLDPANGIPTIGDTIVIRDAAKVTHNYGIIVNGNGKTIDGLGQKRMTVPGSTVLFIYNGTEWVTQTIAQGTFNRKFVSNSDYVQGGYFEANVGDHIARETQYGGGIKIRMPKFANHGDVISIYDLDGLNPVTKTTVIVHPQSGHKIKVSVNSQLIEVDEFETTGWGYYIFDARMNNNAGVWRVFDSDIRPRWKEISASYTAILGEKLMLSNTDPLIPIVVTFPREAADGESFIVDNSYLKKGTQITLKVPDTATNAYIVPPAAVLTNPRVTQYRAMLDDIEAHMTKTEVYTVENRADQWEFALFHGWRSSKDAWMLISSTEVPFRVDRNDITFYGKANIASQAEVNKNLEDITVGQNRDCEAFVTPETLANKTATTTRRGIARLATSSEANLTSGTTEAWTGTLITPERLNNRLATNSMRGVMRIATQAQANAMTGSGELYTQIAITPQTLTGRVATETQTGITYQVLAGQTKQAARGTAGTGVHDFAEHFRYVTPKTLFEKVATDTSQGMVFTGTQVEVNAGTANDVNGPLVVTASTLHGRQSTTTLTGLSRAATNAEILNNAPTTAANVHVTPGELVNRTATETRWGLAETATQVEVDAGTLHDKYFVSPLTMKTWLGYEHLTVTAASGLTTSGSIWSKQNFDIQSATTTQRGTLRVATQTEANAMVSALDTVYITPNKLNARAASETLTGIIEIATQAETDTGTDTTRAVVPSKLLAAVRSSANHRMTETQYGVGQMALLTNDASANSVWQGTNLAGSTRALASYAHNDVVVSPRALNTALANYLPLMATAQSSLSMTTAGGTKVMADDWVRRTVAQTVTGAMTFSAATVMNSGLTVNTTDSHIKLVESDNANKQWNVGVQSGAYTITEHGVGNPLILAAGGAATFNNTVTVGAIDPTTDNMLPRWKYTEDRYVRKTGTVAETITGAKTFTSNMVVNTGATTTASIQIGNTANVGMQSSTAGALHLGSNGTMYLRPTGVTSTTGQATLASTGILTVTDQVRTSATAPLANNDLTRKDYVDNLVDNALSTSGARVSKQGDTMTGELAITAAQALTANGAVDINGVVTVQAIRISVGNGEYVELRPDPVTRSLDWVWVS